MDLLHDKTAIVTGASSGIGRATASLFAAEGANIVLAARRQQELEDLADEIATGNGRAIVLAGNVNDAAYAEALVELAVREFGGLDIAFNNVGLVGTMGPVPELEEADWHTVIDTNLTSAFLAAKHQIPAMLKRSGGSLIFTSSFVGNTVGMPGMAAYGAAKAGILGLTRALASEYGQAGLRVNALLPGGTETAMATFRTADERRFVEGLHAMKRIARPEEIARSALYLASDWSSFTTGTALYADGGVSISRS